MDNPNIPQTTGLSINRRDFVRQISCAGAALVGSGKLAFAKTVTQGRRPICAFIKFIQQLNYDEMASRVAELGFDGIESTVRKGGHVSPDRVEQDLPKQYEAIKSAGLEIALIATDIIRADQAGTRRVLETAASLGIKRYRMGFWYYNRKESIKKQLARIRAAIVDLAALNREYGLSAVYQNHSGPDYVGAPIWDICGVLEDISPDEIGLAFDIRHATIEGGLSWPLDYRLARPHIRAYFIKDFDWKGLKDIHVPLGTGRVDPAYFKELRETDDDYPVSLHVEYLESSGPAENLAALQRDLATLRKLLGV